jgi:hypothetical protein
MNSQAASMHHPIPTASIMIFNWKTEKANTLGDSFNKSIKQVARRRSNKFKLRRCAAQPPSVAHPQSISLIENNLPVFVCSTDVNPFGGCLKRGWPAKEPKRSLR